MKKGDRYRLIIIISYALLFICVLTLLAGLWNRISLNPTVQIGNGMYLLVFVILILATSIFVFHLMEERQVLLPHEKEQEETEEPPEILAESSSEPHEAPFETDLDTIASDVIPPNNPKESTADFAETILTNLARQFEIVQGVLYLKNSRTSEFESLCTYAYTSDTGPGSFREGDGLPGQVAKNRQMMILSSVPEGYLQIQSGLGNASPDNLIILPLLLNKEAIGIIELATFRKPDRQTEWLFSNLAKIIGNAMVTKIKSAKKK